jgi:hypothetical protein
MRNMYIPRPGEDPDMFDLVYSDPLDYWHSLIIFYDGAAYHWQIFNHEYGTVERRGEPVIGRMNAVRAGKSEWRVLAPLADAGRAALDAGPGEGE